MTDLRFGWKAGDITFSTPAQRGVAQDWTQDPTSGHFTGSLPSGKAKYNSAADGGKRAGAVGKWADSVEDSAAIRRSIAKGKPTPEAQVLLDMLREEGEETPKLWRGVAVPRGGVEDKWYEGKIVDLGLTSFSAMRKKADVFMDQRWTNPPPGAEAIRFVLSPGAVGLDLAPYLKSAWRAIEHEWITAGRFRVERVRRITDPWGEEIPTWEISLTQTGVLK